MQNYTPQNPFDAYLWAHGYDDNKDVAKVFGVTAEMVRQWRLPLAHPDFTRPSQRRIIAINAWTQGKVCPNHWFNLAGDNPPVNALRRGFPPGEGDVRIGGAARVANSPSGAPRKARPGGRGTQPEGASLQGVRS